MRTVIIDNVNVAECDFFSKKQQVYCATKPLRKIDNACLLTNSVSFCDGKNCYYKQLQELKQRMGIGANQ